MVAGLVTALIALVFLGFVCAASAARVVKQYERGVIFRLGRLRGAVREPGLAVIVPVIDRLHKVNMQIVTLPVPAQEGITRDNVTVRVDAVVYFRVIDAASALVKVEDYRFAVSQMAQTSLRSIIGKSDLDDLLSNREKLNQGLELMIDSPAVGWGVQVDRVEIKDVSLPETMKRSMARQAEADRERRARIINADAEFQASKKLADAARAMSKEPAALQLRLLQTMVAVAAEKNSTLVLPFPVELLRFLERASGVPVPGPTGSGSTDASSVEGGSVEGGSAKPDATDADAGSTEIGSTEGDSTGAGSTGVAEVGSTEVADSPPAETEAQAAAAARPESAEAGSPATPAPDPPAELRRAQPPAA